MAETKGKAAAKAKTQIKVKVKTGTDTGSEVAEQSRNRDAFPWNVSAPSRPHRKNLTKIRLK